MTPPEILAQLLRFPDCDVSSETREKVLAILPRAELFVRSRLLEAYVVDPATGICTPRPESERIVWKFIPPSDLLRDLKPPVAEVNDTSPQTQIALPDFRDLESCRQFCNALYTEVREKLKSRVHSETQAVNYILLQAKAGELFYQDCLVARRIQKEWNWMRATFTTYCKQKYAPKPKDLKRAAKKCAHIKTRKRMLRDL